MRMAAGTCVPSSAWRCRRCGGAGHRRPQLWLQVVATLRLSEKWRLHLEEQPRLDDADGPTQIIARTALGRRRHRGQRLGRLRVGCQASGQGCPTSSASGTALRDVSHRGAVDALAAPADRAALSGSWSGASHRIRVMGRGVRPFDAGARWSLAVWNELLLTVDETTVGPARAWTRTGSSPVPCASSPPSRARVRLHVGHLRPAGHTPYPCAQLLVWLNLTP